MRAEYWTGGARPCKYAVLVGLYACWGDESASKLVKDFHFPTSGKVPDAPGKRVVEAGSAAALKRAEQEAKNSIGSDFTNRQPESLRTFGEALHPLQDSWSHQGQPNVPPRPLCNTDYAWGHPHDRGGYLTHIADLTYLWPGLVVEAAEVTYKLMIEYLKNNSWAREPKTKARAWTALHADVLRFAAAETKEAKLAWFRQVKFKTFEFLNSINLEDGASIFPRISIERTTSDPKALMQYKSVYDAVVRFGDYLAVVVPTGDGRYHAYFQVKHVPDELVMIELAPTSEGLKVTTVDWVITH